MGRRGETDADTGRVIRSSDGRGGLWRPVAVAALSPWRQHFRAVAGGGFLRHGDLGADDQRGGLLWRQRVERHQPVRDVAERSEEHTSELQSLMRISYAVFCLKKKKTTNKDVKQQTTH